MTRPNFLIAILIYYYALRNDAAGACDLEAICKTLNQTFIHAFRIGEYCYAYTNNTLNVSNLEGDAVCRNMTIFTDQNCSYYGRLATFPTRSHYECAMHMISPAAGTSQVRFGAYDPSNGNYLNSSELIHLQYANGSVVRYNASSQVNNASDSAFGAVNISSFCLSVIPSDPYKFKFSACHNSSFLCEIGYKCSLRTTYNADGSWDDINALANSSLANSNQSCNTTTTIPYAYAPACSLTSTMTSKTASTSTTSETSRMSSVVNKNPMTEKEREAATIMHSLGCAWLIACLAGTIILNFITNFNTMDRHLHLCQEISLLLCHLLILSYVHATNNRNLCTWVSIGIQYFTITYYIFLLCEAVRSYCYITKVILDPESNVGGSVVVGWILPLFITVGTAVMAFDRYPAEFSCWLNVGENKLIIATFGPVIFAAVVSVIVVESAGTYRPSTAPTFLEWYNDNPNAVNAQLNRTGIFWILPLSLAGWVMGLSAVYFQNFASYTIVFGLNLAVGVTIAVFHTLRNEKIQSFVRRICPCGKK